MLYYAALMVQATFYLTAEVWLPHPCFTKFNCSKSEFHFHSYTTTVFSRHRDLEDRYWSATFFDENSVKHSTINLYARNIYQLPTLTQSWFSIGSFWNTIAKFRPGIFTKLLWTISFYLNHKSQNLFLFRTIVLKI